MTTGDQERHGCWASWALDQCDLFHMFDGWKLQGVHSAHSEVSGGPGKERRVDGRRERCAESAENAAQGPGSRVQGQGQGRRTENSKHFE